MLSLYGILGMVAVAGLAGGILYCLSPLDLENL